MSDVLSNTGAEQLKSFATRIERLNEDKAAIMTDIKEVYAEAKASGFTPSILRKVIAERAKDQTKREEEAALFECYWDAVNGILFKDLPEQRAPAAKAKKAPARATA